MAYAADSVIKIKATGSSGDTERTIETVVEIEDVTPENYPHYAPFVIDPDTDLVIGEVFVIKEGAQNGDGGNFGVVALGRGVEDGNIVFNVGGGAQEVYNNIVYGYKGELDVDDAEGIQVYTQPGNMAGKVAQAVDVVIANEKNIIIIPTADLSKWPKNGRKLVTINNDHHKFSLIAMDKNNGKGELSATYLGVALPADVEDALSEDSSVEVTPLHTAEVKS